MFTLNTLEYLLYAGQPFLSFAKEAEHWVKGPITAGLQVPVSCRLSWTAQSLELLFIVKS